jgi:hypothetical protein
MRILLLILLLLTSFWASLLIQNHSSSAESLRGHKQVLPSWAQPAFSSQAFTRDYLLSGWINPVMLQGDFNGDGVVDIAVLVTRKRDGIKGIAVLHGGEGQPIILGAGHAVGNGGHDFSWLGEWSVYPQRLVPPNLYDSHPPPVLRGDALLVEKPESASGIIYWDGGAYRWYQQSD